MSVTSWCVRAGSAAVVTLASAACHYSLAPAAALPIAEQLARDAFGAWAEIRYTSATSGPARVTGELIAVTNDTVFVLSGVSLATIPAADIQSAQIETFYQPLQGLYAWAGMGVVTTLSHGYFLVLSTPVWLITGTAGIAWASRAPYFGTADPAIVARFARFPQGIPVGLDRRALLPRPELMPQGR